MDRTADNSTDRRLSNSPNDREDHLRRRRERERARRAYGTPEQRKLRTTPSAERARQGLPKARTSQEFLLRSARSRIQHTKAAAQEGTEPGTEEGRQADPVSRSKSAQKRRQPKRTEEDYSAYCLMHASLKQSLRGTSSGSPDNALHSLVYIAITIASW